MNRNLNRLQPRLARTRCLALAFLLGPVASAGTSAQPYSVVDLGVDVSPTDINSSGTIVGSMNTGQYPATAIIRDPADGINREIFGGSAGTVAMIANAINDTGLVAGSTLTGAFVADGGSIIHDWDDHGAWGINGHGLISGNRAGNNPYRATSIPYDPAVYEGNKWTVMGIAGVYPRGTRQGVYADIYRLLDINDGGFAVGSKSRYGLAGSSAILISPPYSGVQDAGDVTYLPTSYGGSAAAINNLNMIVGTTGNDSRSATYSHAFLYDYSSSELVDLGTLMNEAGEYGLRSSAADINDQGQVVGSSWLVSVNTSLSDPSRYHAFIWESGQMTDLNDLIDPAPGWVLTAATAINARGDIVGTGLLNGEPHGFLLTSGQSPSPPPVVENLPPVAVATADITRGRAPLEVQFFGDRSHDPEGHAITYAWDFGDGSTASTANPLHVFTQPGPYLVFLTVSDDSGQTDTAQVEITARKGNRKK